MSQFTLYLMMIIGMSIYMLILEWLGNNENVESVTKFFDRTNSTGIRIAKGVKKAIEYKQVTSATAITTFAGFFQAANVSTLWILIELLFF